MKKRIIIAADGTWNDLEMRYITNVGRLVQALPSEGKTGDNRSIPHLLFYDDGVGADASGARRFLEGGVGLGIDNLIYEAYRFISVNWEPGDEICLFGFSRGAYTVRSVAGMLGTLGLVSRRKLKELPRALEVYRSKDEGKQKAFKENVADARPNVTLLGCWDTVGSLGIPDKVSWLPLDRLGRERYRFHDTELGAHIDRALHAVAIDEPRKEFDVTPMCEKRGTRLVQHWFPGDHGSVGGGTWEKRGLSNRCLEWMVDQAKDMGVDLCADLTALHDRAIRDHRIFYLPNTSLIYSSHVRVLDKVEWRDIDVSARRRFADLGEHDSRASTAFVKKFGTKLKREKPSSGVKTTTDPARIAVGDALWVKARARDYRAGTGVQVNGGETYELEIPRTQVWKDGDLDPCDVRGWNTKGGDKAPYKDGREADPGWLKSRLVRYAGNKKLVRKADWFELVLSVNGDAFSALALGKPSNKADPYTVDWTAPDTGELHFGANDLASNLDFIDKYDNNQGWIWVKLSRKS